MGFRVEGLSGFRVSCLGSEVLGIWAEEFIIKKGWP